jgi:hypothetical protein
MFQINNQIPIPQSTRASTSLSTAGKHILKIQMEKLLTLVQWSAPLNAYSYTKLLHNIISFNHQKLVLQKDKYVLR